jgi:hypothetical protein
LQKAPTNGYLSQLMLDLRYMTLTQGTIILQ